MLLSLTSKINSLVSVTVKKVDIKDAYYSIYSISGEDHFQEHLQIYLEKEVISIRFTMPQMVYKNTETISWRVKGTEAQYICVYQWHVSSSYHWD